MSRRHRQPTLWQVFRFPIPPPQEAWLTSSAATRGDPITYKQTNNAPTVTNHFHAFSSSFFPQVKSQQRRKASPSADVYLLSGDLWVLGSKQLRAGPSISARHRHHRHRHHLFFPPPLPKKNLRPKSLSVKWLTRTPSSSPLRLHKSPRFLTTKPWTGQ